MNISTSINVFFGNGSVKSQMKRVYDAGFRHMDINFCDWVDTFSAGGYFPHSDAEWETWVSDIEEFAHEYGVKLNQSHGPLFNILEEGERGDHLRQMCLPSLQAAARLGIPWVVYHAGTIPGDYHDPEHVRRTKELNHRFFDPLAEEAEKLGVGIAIENMTDRFARNGGGFYCADIDQHIDLCDSFHSDYVGICWDTGHANLQHGPRQRELLNKLGSRLKCMHFQDSDGLTDQHTAPFYGKIDWNDMMAGLRDIDYKGDLTFESHNLVRVLPDSCKDIGLALMYKIGCELKARFEA